MSYREFIANLGLAETDLSKILYHLYLDCLNEMIEKDDEQLDQYDQYYRVDKINFLSTLFFTILKYIKFDSNYPLHYYILTPIISV